MKKVLFATTALVATAGVAAADITLSGSAEMGLMGGDRMVGPAPATANDEINFFTDIDVTFTMSGETDNGLTFGAAVDLDEGAGAATGNNYDDGGIAIFISGNFGTVTMGDTDGALDWALTEAGNVGNPGSLADDETEHAGYLGSYADGAGNGDGQILRYDYSFGDFGIALSVEQGTMTVNTITGVAVGSYDYSYAIGFRYGLELGGVDVDLGLGYQVTDFAAGDQSIIGLSAAATFDNGLSAGIQYSDWSDVGGVAGTDNSHIGVGVGYSFDAFSVHANYGEFDSGNSGFGLAAEYDLGGGLTLNLGYGSSDMGATDADFWSFGARMSF